MIEGMHLTAIGDGVVLLEPRDALDPSDPDAYLQALLAYLQDRRARRLIYDLKDVPLIDTLYYEWLKAVNAMCRIGGIELVAANMQPTAAFVLAQRLTEPPPFACALDVDSAR
jgi:anti-anti-sigma regulatory factor